MCVCVCRMDYNYNGNAKHVPCLDTKGGPIHRVHLRKRLGRDSQLTSARTQTNAIYIYIYCVCIVLCVFACNSQDICIYSRYRTPLRIAAAATDSATIEQLQRTHSYTTHMLEDALSINRDASKHCECSCVCITNISYFIYERFEKWQPRRCNGVNARMRIIECE